MPMLVWAPQALWLVTGGSGGGSGCSAGARICRLRGGSQVARVARHSGGKQVRAQLMRGTRRSMRQAPLLGLRMWSVCTAFRSRDPACAAEGLAWFQIFNVPSTRRA